MFKRLLIVLVPGMPTAPVIRPGLALACACQASVVFFTAGIYPQAERLHQQAQQLATGLGLTTRSVIAAPGPAVPAMLAEAIASRCDLIVLAHEGSNALVRLLSGSFIPGLVTASPLPVMVCPPQALSTTSAHTTLARILVVLDDETLAQPTLKLAMELARTRSAELLFIHRAQHVTVPVVDAAGFVMSPNIELTAEMHRLSHVLVASSRRAARGAGLIAHGMSLPAGTSARDIARIAADRAGDLIVLGHHRDNAVTRLLAGSLIPGLITAAAAPVLICRTPG